MRRIVSRWLGPLACLLALAAQLAVATSVPAWAAEDAAPLGVICHADGSDAPAPHAPPHHGADCTLCALCAAAFLPGPVPQAVTEMRPAALASAAAENPPARAPPVATGRFPRIARPRGPPQHA